MKRILLVDDDKFVLSLTEKVLSNANYDVTTATSAAEAIRLSMETTFDLFIFDLNMENIDGFNLADKVRRSALYSQTPIMMLTGEKSKDSMTKGKSLGVSAWATKPIDKTTLLSTVEKLL